MAGTLQGVARAEVSEATEKEKTFRQKQSLARVGSVKCCCGQGTRVTQSGLDSNNSRRFKEMRRDETKAVIRPRNWLTPS